MYLIYLALIPCIILEAKTCQFNDMATAKRDDKGKKTHLSDKMITFEATVMADMYPKIKFY